MQENIIRFLFWKDFHTPAPLIYMELCDGNLGQLFKLPGVFSDDLLRRVLGQMLSALDYLDNERLIHRDIKPENILYIDRPAKELGTAVWDEERRYKFLLADFGLANCRTVATTPCGTGCYAAPEVFSPWSGIYANQTSKVDVWSLFATMIAAHPRFPDFPPPRGSSYQTCMATLLDHAPKVPLLEPMARADPAYRASAAQMLVALFDGQGMTTKTPTPLGPAPKKDRIPIPQPAVAEAVQIRRNPPRQTRNNLLIQFPQRSRPLRNQLRIGPQYGTGIGNLFERRKSRFAQPPAAATARPALELALRPRGGAGVVKHRPAVTRLAATPMAIADALEEDQGRQQQRQQQQQQQGQQQPQEQRSGDIVYRIPGAFPPSLS